MNRYTLVAVMDDTSNGTFINAQTNEDAMMQAINFILDKAMDSKLWAKGHIKLMDIEGRLVAEMGAK
jgi:protein associated with RNAse G/E